MNNQVSYIYIYKLLSCMTSSYSLDINPLSDNHLQMPSPIW